MKAINVSLGNLPGNPRHCFDGDSTYLSGSLENALVRLSGVDAFEVRGMNISYLRKSKFLYRLNFELRKYLEPKLTEQSVRIHKDLGFKARDYLELILEEELVLTFGTEIFDRYERPLVYLSVKDKDTYNLKLVQAGYALPYFIYPNAVSPAEDGEWNYDALQKFRDATVEAVNSNLGIWRYIEYTLLPMELRYLTRREPPLKYCADLENDLLYSPQYYFKVPIEDRLFFYPRDVLTALQKEFKPAPECDGWLHRVWRSLHEDMKEEDKVKAEIERQKRKKKKRRI